MTWRDASIDWRDPAGGIPIWLTLLIGIVAALICTAIAAAIGVAATPGIDWINPAGMGGDNSVVITAVLSALGSVVLAAAIIVASRRDR